MTTYTVVDQAGDVIARGLSVADAAHKILTDDGYGYEIRPEPDGTGWALWVTQFSRNSPLGGKPMVRTIFWSLKPSEEAARAEIFEKVVSTTWTRRPDAIPDDDYDAVVAELAEQEEEA